MLEGNLDTLTKLVTKGKKLLPEVVQDRRQKVGARSASQLACAPSGKWFHIVVPHCRWRTSSTSYSRCLTASMAAHGCRLPKRCLEIVR